MGEVTEKKAHVSHDDEERVMCRHGFHDWISKDEKRMDESTQKMLTVYKCSHCGKEMLDD